MELCVNLKCNKKHVCYRFLKKFEEGDKYFKLDREYCSFLYFHDFDQKLVMHYQDAFNDRMRKKH